jgi:hypothetical protein
MVGSSPFFNPVSGASIEANNEAIYMLAGIPQVCGRDNKLLPMHPADAQDIDMYSGQHHPPSHG